MNEIRNIVENSLKSTYATLKVLIKAIIPIIFLTTFIKMVDILPKISEFFDPMMSIFGLPGDATLPLFFGIFINTYAAVGAISSLDLSGSEVTTLALMLLICHSLLLETTVLATIAMKKHHQIIIRVGLMLFSGIVVGGLYGIFN